MHHLHLSATLEKEKIDRNWVMLHRHQDGDTLAEIADYFDISIQRVHQIVNRIDKS